MTDCTETFDDTILKAESKYILLSKKGLRKSKREQSTRVSETADSKKESFRELKILTEIIFF